MINKTDELNGAWEERGVIGTRVEIDGRKIAVLWRNAPVLETTFRAKEQDGDILLELRKNGLRYAGASSDYAKVVCLRYGSGKLEFVKYFPITGENSETLTKTENSRYGNYSVENDVLHALQGTWKSKNSFFDIVICKDELSMNGEKTKICVLRSKNPCEPQGRYEVANRDPSVYEWQGLSRFIYENGRLTTRMFVCDAPSVEIVFEKV